MKWGLEPWTLKLLDPLDDRGTVPETPSMPLSPYRSEDHEEHES